MMEKMVTMWVGYIMILSVLSGGVGRSVDGRRQEMKFCIGQEKEQNRKRTILSSMYKQLFIHRNQIYVYLLMTSSKGKLKGINVFRISKFN